MIKMLCKVSLIIFFPLFFCFIVLLKFSKEPFTLLGFEDNPTATMYAWFTVVLILIFSICILSLYFLLWCIKLIRIITEKDTSKIIRYTLFAFLITSCFICFSCKFGLYYAIILTEIIGFNVVTFLGHTQYNSLLLTNAVKYMKVWLLKTYQHK